MNYKNIQEIAKAISGKLVNYSEDKETNVTDFQQNSKFCTDGSLFFAIIGENIDGHKYIDYAIKNGAKVIIINNDNKDIAKNYSDIIFVLVNNTYEAFHMLAKHVRQRINPLVIAVTGSVGKTSTKDIISAVVKEKYNTYSTVGNYNNLFGLPLTILNMDKNTEVLILEMGMNSFGEIKELCSIAKPNIACITNIGESHIEHLGSKEGIFKAKMEITTYFDKSNTLIVNGDDDYLSTLNFRNLCYNVIMVGEKTNNNYRISNIKPTIKSNCFTVDNTDYELNMLGRFNAKNSLFAIVIGKLLNIENSLIKKALKNVVKPNRRLNFIENEYTIVDDSYNASYDSIKEGANFIYDLDGYKRKVFILGDVLECGEEAENIHKRISDVLLKDKINFLITIGDYSRLYAKNFKHTHVHYNNVSEAIKDVKNLVAKGDLIYVKASNGMNLNKLINELDK